MSMHKEKTVRGRPFGNKNAAKPQEQHRILFAASVAPETLAKIKAYAQAHGVSIGKAIDALILR
ncbi:MAG: hypothetical protein E7037_04250 [Verrucomicrobia bacterium]|nr:hypothetical protein [Verrucomicrobiota bacterium]